ncbi:MAG: GNAT family N-acetyltransferase [Erythrobacter sp.]
MQFQLQKWSEVHRLAFSEMQRDSEVMADLGGPFDDRESSEKFDRYRDAWDNDGISRWAVMDLDNEFLGYAGVMKRTDPNHPLGLHYEIGWRFRRDAWGKGYASRAAKLALAHAWTVLPVDEIVSYTAADNLRSRKVMERLALARCCCPLIPGQVLTG